MKKNEYIIFGIILLSFIISIYFYPQMPEIIATHWDAQGQVNGYMPRFWGLFLMPIVLAVIGLIFIAIPRLDPLRENINKFKRYYDGFIILLLIFMLLMQFQGILWNLGYQISPNTILPIGLGLLFFYAGILTENAKMNWSIGVRTPWTLSNEKVWNKTNKLTGKLFKIAGIITLFGFLFPDQAVYFILIPAIFVAIFSFVYSYIEYQKQMKKGRP